MHIFLVCLSNFCCEEVVLCFHLKGLHLCDEFEASRIALVFIAGEHWWEYTDRSRLRGNRAYAAAERSETGKLNNLCSSWVSRFRSLIDSRTQT